MYWIEIVPTLILGAAVIVIPGLFMGAVLGLRGMPLVSRSPLFSIGMIGVGAVVLSMLGISFTPITIVLVSAVFVLAAMLLMKLLRRGVALQPGGETASVRQYFLIAGAIAVAAVGIFLSIKQGIINPDAVAQLSDVIFHLNAVEYILDSGDGSTLSLGAAVSATGAPSLYPAGWHDLHALIHAITGGSIVATANATMIVVAALAWPLSVLSLAWSQRAGKHSSYFVAGAVACTSLTLAFPSKLLTWGVLYPMLLSLALVPALVAVAIELIRAIERRQYPAIVSASGQLLIGAAALTVAQPSALVSAAALLIPFLVHATLVQFRVRPRPRGMLIFLGLVLVTVAIGWILVRPARERWWERGVLGYGETWGPTLKTAHAVGDFFTSALGYDPVLWVFALLTWVGAWAAWRSVTSRWLVVSWLLTGFLWVVASSWDFSLVRVILVGPWYNDEYRLAAMTAIPAAMLAGHGVGAVAGWLEKLAARIDPSGHRKWVRAAVAVAMLIGLFLASGSRPVRDAWGQVSQDYAVHEHSIILTEDELDVLEQLERYVPPDDVILVNPWEGGALAYSMANREVTSRHVSVMVQTPYAPIVTDINELGQRDEVCRLVHETQAYWYLDFENVGRMGGAQNDVFAPLEEAADSGLMEPVYVTGDVGLYRIDVC